MFGVVNKLLQMWNERKLIKQGRKAERDAQRKQIADNIKEAGEVRERHASDDDYAERVRNKYTSE